MVAEEGEAVAVVAAESICHACAAEPRVTRNHFPKGKPVFRRARTTFADPDLQQ
jgi:hypothetical protein